MQVVVNYNINSSTVDQVFGADITVSNNTAKSFMLTVCVRRNSDNASQAMVLVEIGVPSGYDVARRKSRFGTASRVEFPEGLVVLYYDSVRSSQFRICGLK